MKKSPGNNSHGPLTTKRRANRVPDANQVGTPDLDLNPGAWSRFEALVKSAAKMGHKPHEASKKNKPR